MLLARIPALSAIKEIPIPAAGPAPPRARLIAPKKASRTSSERLPVEGAPTAPISPRTKLPKVVAPAPAAFAASIDAAHSAAVRVVKFAAKSIPVKFILSK